MKAKSEPDGKSLTKAIPEVHNVATREILGATLSTIEGEKVAEPIGVNNRMKKMLVILQLKV